MLPASPCSVHVPDIRRSPEQNMKHLRFILICCSALIAGCVTPLDRAPKAVTVTENLRFTWRPPIGTPERETTISAGRYVFEKADAASFIYSSATGLVSVAKPGEKTEEIRGGIGIDRTNGAIYVWRADTSVAILMPVGPALVQGSGGRPLQMYIGKIPKELQTKLVFE
jgi:hypothetical protein